jgi:SAM-dependent methyltransferase
LREIEGVCVPDGAGTWLEDAIKTATYEQYMHELVRAYVLPHHRVLEGGSGVGYITRLLTERAQAVVSCEVSRELVRCARKNAPMADILECVLRPKGTDPAQSVPDTGDGFGVDTSTLPGGMDPNVLIGACKLNAVVLDVEGAEGEILLSLDLDPIELIIVEMHPTLCTGKKLGEAHLRLIDNGFYVAEEITNKEIWHAAFLREEVSR